MHSELLLLVCVCGQCWEPSLGCGQSCCELSIYELLSGWNPAVMFNTRPWLVRAVRLARPCCLACVRVCSDELQPTWPLAPCDAVSATVPAGPALCDGRRRGAQEGQEEGQVAQQTSRRRRRRRQQETVSTETQLPT